jgi:Ferritin-like domain
MPDFDPHSLRLDDFDVDGAVRDTLARVPQHTRSAFLRRTARTGAVVVGALAMRPAAAAAASASRSDVAIFNFALALEYLQASFYTEAERIGALSGALAEQANVVGAHERAHVASFKALLGSAAIKEPSFNFHGVTENPDAFRSTAVAFEDLAVAAYKQQAPLIQSPTYLAGALAIHSVEARHAAWIRRLAGFLPAARAFDDPLGDRRVIDIVNSTRFVTLQAPDTSAQTAPGFTG